MDEEGASGNEKGEERKCTTEKKEKKVTSANGNSVVDRVTDKNESGSKEQILCISSRGETHRRALLSSSFLSLFSMCAFRQSSFQMQGEDSFRFVKTRRDERRISRRS